MYNHIYNDNVIFMYSKYAIVYQIIKYFIKTSIYVIQFLENCIKKIMHYIEVIILIILIFVIK